MFGFSVRKPTDCVFLFSPYTGGVGFKQSEQKLILVRARLIQAYVIAFCCGALLQKKQAHFLHHRIEHQSGRFSVQGPFCMSELLQLFVTPCQDSSARCSAPTKAWYVCVCVLIAACMCVHDSRLRNASTVCVCVCVCPLVCLLEGHGAPLLSWASLQAMPRARNQDTTSREGGCVFVWM